MKSSISRLSFFALAVAVGASAFGFFWSAQVQGRGVGGSNPTYCNQSADAPMCYHGATGDMTVTVPPATQASYLSNGQATCGACATSGT